MFKQIPTGRLLIAVLLVVVYAVLSNTSIIASNPSMVSGSVLPPPEDVQAPLEMTENLIPTPHAPPPPGDSTNRPP